MINFLRKIISPDNFFRLLWHKSKAILANLIYGFPGKKLVVIGITGTNGKTTTTYLAESMLRAAGKKVAMFSTVEFSIDGEKKANPTKMTTLSPFKIQKFLKECVKKDIEYVVLETSSHALHQHRLWGIPFRIAVITNITHEHLDYHKTMEKYKNAKKMLFEQMQKACKKKTPKALEGLTMAKGAMVLNTADDYYEEFSQMACPVKISYGLDKGVLHAADINVNKEGSKFKLNYQEEGIDVEMNMTGTYNIENAMAAAGAALACNAKLADIKKGLKDFDGIQGRGEKIKSPKGFEAIVDFALTADSLDRLYKGIKDTNPNRILGLIGSCGDRDFEKRPDLGRIVATYCDITVVTDEETYGEDPKKIMDEVYAGAKATGKHENEEIYLIEDRKEAIEFLIKEALEGDVVVITGMGHFDKRNTINGAIDWKEAEIVEEIIKQNA